MANNHLRSVAFMLHADKDRSRNPASFTNRRLVIANGREKLNSLAAPWLGLHECQQPIGCFAGIKGPVLMVKVVSFALLGRRR